MKVLQLACTAFVVATASGCATITSNDTQVVSLSTKGVDGRPIDKARCSLRNNKGAWDATSPAFVTVRRSAEDLIVECKKEGIPDGLLRAISRAAGNMWGNILFGGVPGALIDHGTGTGYDYPNDLAVSMGMVVTVDRKEELEAQLRAAAVRNGAVSSAQAGAPGSPSAIGPDNSMGYPPGMGGFQNFGGRPAR